MSGDLRERLKEIGKLLSVQPFEAAVQYRNIARDAIERLEGAAAVPEVCIDAVKWQQKPLDCQGVKLGEVGKIDIQECEIPIPAGPIDIRQFTCRRA